MVRELYNEYYEEKIEIWQECFGDSKEYIEMFLMENQKRVRAFGYLEGDTLVSVAYLLPTEYVWKETKTLVYYLYAAATKTAFRGRGYFGQVLCFVRDNLKEPIILVPAEKKLIGFYEKYGMQQILEEKKEIYSKRTDNGNITLEDITPQEYFERRMQYFQAIPLIGWDLEMMQYIVHENEYCGGICKKICVNDREIPLILRENGEKLEILEILSEEEISQITAALCEKRKCSECIVHIQPDLMAYSKSFDFSKQLYFNLCMG